MGGFDENLAVDFTAYSFESFVDSTELVLLWFRNNINRGVGLVLNRTVSKNLGESV